MGILTVLEGSEERTYSWHRDDPDEVERVGRAFRGYRDRGFVACRLSGGQGGPLPDFDPEAEEIFMLELLHGG